MRLPVNMVNLSRDSKAAPFTKLGFIDIHSDGTLTQLRHAMTSHFDVKHFVFKNQQMNDIQPSDENDVTVEDMFTLSVIIKTITEQGNLMYCTRENI